LEIKEADMSRIGVLGSGGVGQTLAGGFRTHGHDVRIGSRSPEKLEAFATAAGVGRGTFAEVAAWGELLVLAVRGAGAQDALTLAGAGNVDGKVIIDTTNPISDAPPVNGVLQYFTGPNNSLMEQLQQAFPGARLVKAFNSVNMGSMVNPSFEGGRPTMFYCGNDPAARETVRRVIEDFGWEPADMGMAEAARAIEPLAQLVCIPGFLRNSWAQALRMLWT
jgi:predicted dinucleotide-binding enzyme